MPAKKPATKQNGGPPARTFEEFQFIVVPVLLVREDGQVPFAHAGDQVTCRGLVELQAFVDRFPADLAVLNAESARAEPA